jgi:hypothetical protein
LKKSDMRICRKEQTSRPKFGKFIDAESRGESESQALICGNGRRTDQLTRRHRGNLGHGGAGNPS